MKKRKIKLPFFKIENEFPTLLSPEELKSIVGGLYDNVNNEEDFINNINQMVSSGMLNYYGTGNYDSGFLDFGDSGSGGSGSSLTFGSEFMIGSGTPYINFNNVALLFEFGSSTGSGGSTQPGPLIYNFGNGGSATFTGAGGTDYKVNVNTSDGKKFGVEFKNGKWKLTIGINL